MGIDSQILGIAMNRSHYFDYIEERLSLLVLRIGIRGRLNVLNLNVHAENFYVHLFNELFDLSLVNTNTNIQNAEAIDLIDAANKIIIQVSATSTKQKIDSALSKDMSSYVGYRFKFIPIVHAAAGLSRMKYTVPVGVVFDPTSDIHDMTTILRDVGAKSIDELRCLFDLVRKELGEDVGTEYLETNLAEIVNILSNEDLSDVPQGLQVDPFEVERKISFNNLESLRHLIEGYAVHYSRLDGIYAEFDLRGVNKSASVLASINAEYLRSQAGITGEDIFYTIIRKTAEKVQHSSNFNRIPLEELELASTILVVDAFIRCKVFKNPNKYSHVAA